MPLPNPNLPISLSQVNVELGNNVSAQISMNDTAVRTLFQRPGNATLISMSDGWGKSNCPPYGTFLSYYCSGYTKVGTYANGSCGTYTQILEYNSQDCGYCDPYGTFIGYYCNGTTKYAEYANGSCGTYSNVEEYNACDCGGSGPGYGTELDWYCDGYTKVIVRFCGCGCTYNDTESNSVDCGYTGGGGGGGGGGGCSASVDCDCYCNHISSSAYSNSGASIASHTGQQKTASSEYDLINFAGWATECSTSSGSNNSYLFCNGIYGPWSQYKATVTTSDGCYAESETSPMTC